MMGAIHVLLTPHRNYIKGKIWTKRQNRKLAELAEVV